MLQRINVILTKTSMPACRKMDLLYCKAAHTPFTYSSIILPSVPLLKISLNWALYVRTQNSQSNLTNGTMIPDSVGI
jgi:hypothetical protein